MTLSPVSLRHFRLEQLGVIGCRRKSSTVADAVRVCVMIQGQLTDHGFFGLSLRLKEPITLDAIVNTTYTKDAPIVRSWGPRHTMHVFAGPDSGLAAAAMAASGIWTLSSERDECLIALERVLKGKGGKTKKEMHPELGDAAQHLKLYSGVLHHSVALGKTLLWNKKSGQNVFVWRDDVQTQAPPVPERIAMIRELGCRYFQCFGPASIRDAQKWLGSRATLKELTDLASTDDRLTKVTVEGVDDDLYACRTDIVHVLNTAAAEKALAEHPVLMLPAFDAVQVGYAMKSFWFRDPNTEIRHVWKKAAIVEPAVVHRGYIVGVWRMRKAGNGVEVRVQLFASLGSDADVVKVEIEGREKRGLESFYGLDVELFFVDDVARK